MIMNFFYVYRKQFPLILANAVTIQGLSLDCAIVDLSDDVFSEGMAYVALSRVRSLSGLYITAFNPQSIMVSTKCLKEVNRLRRTFRKDLPLYDIPLKSANTAKGKLTGITNDDLPNAKKSKLDAASTKNMNRQNPSTQTTQAKRKCSHSNPTQTHENPFKFNPGKQWQQDACSQMGLQFYTKNRVRVGGPNAP